MPECTGSKHLTQHQESQLQTRAALVNFAYQLSSVEQILSRICSERSHPRSIFQLPGKCVRTRTPVRSLSVTELTKALNQEYLPVSRAHFWKEKLRMSLWC